MNFSQPPSQRGGFSTSRPKLCFIKAAQEESGRAQGSFSEHGTIASRRFACAESTPKYTI